jgi:hypothetical protein
VDVAFQTSQFGIGWDHVPFYGPIMNQLKIRGEGAPHNESFVELRIDDLVRESVTWPAQTKSGFGFSEPLPNVIHRSLALPELH